MAANYSLTHGIMLVQHHHFKEAEQEFRQLLAQSPENAMAHAMLAMALTAQDRSKEAVAEARRAVGLAPNMPYCHYVLSMVLLHSDQYPDALASINEALRIDPEEADYYEIMGKIYMSMDDWNHALDAARKGLSIDPQNVDCANLEAMALVHLGRQGEAGIAIEAALRKDPENAVTHANLGWADLHGGKHQDALVHFREALRLNPNLEWARRGIIESMKARNILYRPILAYFLWMSRLSSQVRWGFIVGLYALVRVIRSAASYYPDLTPFVMPVVGLYMAFALMSWIAKPLFNLFLRLDTFGRLALSAEEITASNWLGLCFFGGLGLLLAGIPARSDTLVKAGIGLFAMSIPVSGIFYGRSRKSRIILTAYAVGLAVIGLLAVLFGLQTGSAGELFVVVFIFGWVAYTWLGNILMNIQ